MKEKTMNELRIINLVMFIVCIGISLICKNYVAAAGWFVASLLQINIIIGEKQ